MVQRCVGSGQGLQPQHSVDAGAECARLPCAQIAKRQAVVNPENTFFSVKRFIGRKMNEVGDESKQASLRCASLMCSGNSSACIAAAADCARIACTTRPLSGHHVTQFHCKFGSAVRGSSALSVIVMTAFPPQNTAKRPQ